MDLYRVDFLCLQSHIAGYLAAISEEKMPIENKKTKNSKNV